jgi:hypothetical protein
MPYPRHLACSWQKMPPRRVSMTGNPAVQRIGRWNGLGYLQANMRSIWPDDTDYDQPSGS